MITRRSVNALVLAERTLALPTRNPGTHGLSLMTSPFRILFRSSSQALSPRGVCQENGVTDLC